MLNKINSTIKGTYSIWIVEDDMVSQFASRYCLQQFAKDTFVIYTFDSAEEALQQIKHQIKEKEELPDLIFLDLGLGGMNGWTFLDHLAPLVAKGKKPEIYILSAFARIKDRELANKHPMVAGYFDKPLARNRLEIIFKAKRS
ncbi:MAG: response regulator [Bacteroidota bacterium]